MDLDGVANERCVPLSVGGLEGLRATRGLTSVALSSRTAASAIAHLGVYFLKAANTNELTRSALDETVHDSLLLLVGPRTIVLSLQPSRTPSYHSSLGETSELSSARWGDFLPTIHEHNSDIDLQRDDIGGDGVLPCDAGATGQAGDYVHPLLDTTLSDSAVWTDTQLTDIWTQFSLTLDATGVNVWKIDLPKPSEKDDKQRKEKE